MNEINNLTNEMIKYYSGQPKRIQHFLKVHAFAKLIGQMENLDDDTAYVLEVAAIVHDIGIKEAERKFCRCDGNLQEQEGPPIAKEMLSTLHFDNEVIKRVMYLIAHHHTYKNVDGQDYQILIEADFLVNLYEDNSEKPAILSAYNKIFKTDSGKKLCEQMFAL